MTVHKQNFNETISTVLTIKENYPQHDIYQGTPCIDGYRAQLWDFKFLGDVENMTNPPIPHECNARVKRAHVAWQYVGNTTRLSESDLVQILKGNGITLADNDECGRKGEWLLAKRFGKVMDWYAVSKTECTTHRKINMMKLLCEHTGHMPWNFI